MIKKVLVCLLLCMLIPMGSVFAEISFPDLPDTHWAHSDVSKMVADGRVNGFPDGEFKPNENVTRWQFVKMMGGSNPDDTAEPHRAATRGEAAEFLWIKAGSPEAVAPSAVTVNTVNEKAAAWAYSVGIMEGDDGFNLRLDFTLTRAEAAALIIRSESSDLTPNNFKDTVDSKILEKVWNAMGTGIVYDEARTVSNGEIAGIAVRIGYEKRMPDYTTLLKNPEFEGKYAREMQLVAQECLGESAASAEFHEKPATMQDMVSVLSFYTMKQVSDSVLFMGEDTYKDVSGVVMPMAEIGLKFAKSNGVFLYADNVLKATENATVKDVACVLALLDEAVGLNKSAGTVKPLKILKNVGEYPANAGDYAYILEGIPSNIYKTPLIEGTKPVDFYVFANDFKSIFASFLNNISLEIPEGVEVEWTVIPSLIAESDSDTVIRAGLKIVSNPKGLSLNEIFAKNTLSEKVTGENFYVDISVGQLITSFVVPTDKYNVTKAFAVGQEG